MDFIQTTDKFGTSPRFKVWPLTSSRPFPTLWEQSEKYAHLINTLRRRGVVER